MSRNPGPAKPDLLDDADLDTAQGGTAFEKIIMTYDDGSDASLVPNFTSNTGPAMDGLLLEVRASTTTED